MSPEARGAVIGIPVGIAAGFALFWSLYLGSRPLLIRQIAVRVPQKLRATQAGPILAALQAPGISDALGAALAEAADDALPGRIGAA